MKHYPQFFSPRVLLLHLFPGMSGITPNSHCPAVKPALNSLSAAHRKQLTLPVISKDLLTGIFPDKSP